MPIRPILSPPIPCLPIRTICIHMSVVHFLHMEVGEFFRSLYVSLDREGFNITSHVIRWHVACIPTGVLCRDKICHTLWPMLAGGVVIGEIVYQIMFSINPIYQKLSLIDSIYDPVKLHVDYSWTSLEDIVIEKYVSCSAVYHCWGGWLGVTHLCEWHACFCDSLEVLKKGYQFYFHCASEDVSYGCKFDINWSIEWRLI